MTTFTGLAGGAGFFASGLGVTGGGGGGAITDLAAGAGVAAVFAAAGACCAFAAMTVVFDTWAEAWLFASGLAVLDTADFFTGRRDFFAEAVGATFFAAGLAILLAAGSFLAVLFPPDEWADFEADFFAGAGFLTLTVFLAAGFAAFFLVAIQLGFFSDEHF
jgi:hypothetical protein